MPLPRSGSPACAMRRWGMGSAMVAGSVVALLSTAQALDFAYPTDASYAHFNRSASVSGSLRIGNGGETCDSSLTGTMRYAGGIFEFCSGSNWQSLAAAAGGGVLDTLVSGTTRVTANGTGFISFTTGGATTGYFDTVGRLVVPGVSSTGAISTTSIFSQGPVVSAAINAGNSTSIDFALGNIHYTTADCGAFTLSGMQDGGTYALVVQGANSNVCVFTHPGLSMLLPSTHGATVAGKHTYYSFNRAGSYVYVSFVRGY